MPKDDRQAEWIRAEIRDVRETNLEIVLRMEDILLLQIPQMLTNHALKVGCWEQTQLKADLAAYRARRRLALAQAQADRGVAPDLSDIESQLDAELAEWTAAVEASHEAYERVLSHPTATAPLNVLDLARLKNYYRTLVRRLHPDVSPPDDGERVSIFVSAQDAYQNRDLETLSSLELFTRHLEPSSDDLENCDDVALLAQELEFARIEQGVMVERLNELEEDELMALGRLLDDPERLTRRITELKRSIDECDGVRRACDERLSRLTEGPVGTR